MIMEDDKLKDIFAGYNPKLPEGDNAFMAQLMKNMEQVELVKAHSASRERYFRRAVVIAALTGILVGGILALLLPLFGSMIANVSFELPGFISVRTMHLNWQLVAWAIIAVTSMVSALNAFDLAMARQRR